jgi:hypothetical protein
LCCNHNNRTDPVSVTTFVVHKRERVERITPGGGWENDAAEGPQKQSAKQNNGDSPSSLSSNPSPERIDESVSGKSPLEERILFLPEFAMILE